MDGSNGSGASSRELADLRESALVAGWTPDATERALATVRSAMSHASGLLPVAEAAARAIGRLLSCWEVTITLIDGDRYWDIVDIIDDPDDDYPRFPDYRYKLSDFPIGTERMLSGKGYVSGNAADEVLIEFERQWPEVPVKSIMSVPIVALGGVHGEIFCVRTQDLPAFTREDLDVASELATLFGARLPALVSTYLDAAATTETAGERRSMPRLTGQLREMLSTDQPGE